MGSVPVKEARGPLKSQSSSMRTGKLPKGVGTLLSRSILVLPQTSAAWMPIVSPCSHLRDFSVTDKFYLVESGKLRLENIEQSGFGRPLLVYEAGSILNLCSAIQGQAPQGIYECIENCVLWAGSAEFLRKPENAAAFPLLWHAALANCSSIILTYAGALTFLGGASFLNRFCRYLLLNVRRYNSPEFCTGLTQAQCAPTLGVHRATLLRCVSRLRSAGILGEFSRRRIEIKDEARLVEWCQL